MKSVAERHPWKTKIILILFGPILFLAVGELAVRALEYYQYVKASNRVIFEQYKRIYSDERDKDYLFGHKQNINVKLEKGNYSFTFITNSEGLRETKDYENIKKSVIFLGDSIVEGSSVENDETMDEVFERQTGITALNFGLGSSNTVQEFYWIESKYKNGYNTKLIILGFCLNDFPQNTYLRYFDPSYGNWQLYKYLSNGEGEKANDRDKKAQDRETFCQKVKDAIKMSRFATLFYNSIQNIRTSKRDDLPPFRFDQVNEEQKYFTELYINKIREFSRQIGSEFVVIIFPQESQLRYEYTSHERMQDALIEILERNRIAYIDLYNVLKINYQTRPDVHWFYDDTHPYKEGHRLIGEYLAQELPKTFPGVFE